jgi:radical SAM protein with 4Fe4S-binding SPASM domain
MNGLKAVEIEINSNCNRACSYCPNADNTRPEQGQMTHETFEVIISQLQSVNYNGRISFSFYNEPLLSKDLEFFSKQIKNKLPKTNILLYTNGTLLTKLKFDSLVNSGVDHFVVTKHEGEINYIFEKTLSVLSPEIIQKHISYKSYSDLKLTNRGGLIPDVQKKFETIDLPCTIPLHMMTITNQGTVVPCFEDYHQVHAVGNLREKTLSDIWNSIEYNTFRKKLLLGKRCDYSVCSKCNRSETLGVF